MSFNVLSSELESDINRWLRLESRRYLAQRSNSLFLFFIFYYYFVLDNLTEKFKEQFIKVSIESNA